MGTSEFAVGILRALLEGGARVVGVVTPPDKPTGRHGNALQPCPVKRYADAQGLPTLQPEKLDDGAFLSSLRARRADLQIVAAFRMLPESVWAMPPLGTFNLHASLLPRYRGAAPINWAIINGETTTGVTTFYLSNTMDGGEIILQKELAIAETDDAGAVHDALMTLGAGLTLETLDLILSGNAHPIPQEQRCGDIASLPTAPKLFRDNCRIDWQQPVANIYNFIRGLSPRPTAWTELVLANGSRIAVKIAQAEKRLAPQPHRLPCGTLVTDQRTFIDVAASDGFVRLLSIQPAGKRRMSAAEFLRGFRQIRGARVG